MAKKTAHSFELTQVMKSPVHGLGLFAKIDIPKGTEWWRGEPDKNILLFSEEQYLNLNRSEKKGMNPFFWKMLATYSYYSKKHGSLVLCLDNARYVNHSLQPNSGQNKDKDPLASVAIRDIKAGEEILENYEEYDPCPWVAILDF
jgi:uncharacterized protein